MSEPSSPSVPLAEIQAGVFDPLILANEAHLFVQITDPVGARTFLRSIVGEITTEAQAATADVVQPQVRLSLGFTWTGLGALDVDGAVLASFPEEFRDGMAARAKTLGDNGASDPEHWEWPFGSATLHGWLMVQGTNADVVDAKVDDLSQRISACDGLAVIGSEEGAQLGPERAPAKEHFGFNDNLSQPGVAGVGQPVYDGQGTLQPDGTWAPIPVGCFLLGYENGFGKVETRPSDPRLRENGTYMVFRKLEQDVAAFRAYVAETAQLLGMDPEMCAAKFVGRWRSGAPLELAPDHDDPSILDNPATADAFAYRAPGIHRGAPEGDPDGERVPRTAHIRRVNPRDSLSDRSMIDPKNHRIIRRSAPYGPFLDEAAAADNVDRGLLFRAFNASILDQFEMIQSEWVNSANEANGLSSDRDALVGSVEPVGPEARRVGASFTIPRPDGSCPSRYNLPKFVTVRGGAYFFVPSMTALQTLAAAVPDPGPPPPSGDPAEGFVAQYEAIGSEPDRTPAEIARAQTMLVLEYQAKLVALGDDLRASDATKIFSTPIGYLLSTYADITEVFTHDESFSVCGYGERLADATGAFMLGLDAGPQYEHETAVMRSVAPSWELPAIGEWIGRYAAEVVGQAALGGSFDLVAAVANRVPLGFVGHYFGVPGPNDDIFMTWLRVIGVHVFEFWSPLDPRIKQMVGTITPALESYLDTLIQNRLALIEAGAAVPDDVLTRLLALAGEDAAGTAEPPGGLDLLGIRRNLAGFAVGSSVALSVAIVSAVQYLLQPENTDAHQVTVAAAKAGNSQLVSQCMLEAARLGAPSPPSLFRTALTDYVLARGTARETVIPKGSIVALYPVVAMTDPEFIDDPHGFRPGRSASNYVMFGEGMHNCFGTAIATMLLGAVGEALFSINGLHEVAPMTSGQGVPGTYYPGHYELAIGG